MTDTIHCKTYNIYFDRWDRLQEIIDGDHTQIIVITDENTVLDCLPVFRERVVSEDHLIVVPTGEIYKNLDTTKYIWEEMLRAGADRHSLCINLGGGVIGDMGGWAAAAYMRGMDFIQVPTTLLSMVDASVGGKLAIDFRGFKNLIGQIIDPLAVFIFPEFLKTLPQRELRSGYAEVLKHGLIADARYWEKVKTMQVLPDESMKEIIYPSVRIKQSVTEEDPYEKGKRKILNFGHTIGHAIESHALQGEDPLLHGEAIVIGMICESFLSYRMHLIDKNDLEDISSHILRIYGKRETAIPDYENLKFLLHRDKKNKGSTVMYTLLEAIGTATYNREVPEKWISESLQYYKSL